MSIDVTKLTANDIAVLAIAAGLVTAVVAAVTTVISGMMSARAARTLARDTTRREFRARDLESYKLALDKQVLLYHRLINAGNDISALLTSGAAKMKRAGLERKDLETIPDIAAAMGILDGLTKGLDAGHMSVHDVGLFGQLLRDAKLIFVMQVWMRANTEFTEKFQDLGGVTTNQAKVKELQDTAWKCLIVAAALRMEMEEFIVGRPLRIKIWHWLRRQEFTMDK